MKSQDKLYARVAQRFNEIKLPPDFATDKDNTLTKFFDHDWILVTVDYPGKKLISVINPQNYPGLQYVLNQLA